MRHAASGETFGLLDLDAQVHADDLEADVALEKSQNPNELKQKFREAGIAFTEV